jgi:hypothetical protein
VSSIISQLGKSRFQTFKTLDEALKFLNEVDNSLPNLSEQLHKSEPGNR